MPKIELSKRLLLFIEFIPIFFMSLTIHEYAHAFVAFKKGDNTAKDIGRLTLNPIKHIDPLGSLLIPFLAYFTGAMLIGWAKPVPVNRANLKRPKTDDILVSIAGPVSNLLLALLLFAFVYILRNELMFSGILVNILWMGV